MLNHEFSIVLTISYDYMYDEIFIGLNLDVVLEQTSYV